MKNQSGGKGIFIKHYLIAVVVVFRATVVKQERTSYDPRKVEIMLGDKISMVEKTTAVTSVKLVALPSF
jgi:hypothetical protein